MAEWLTNRNHGADGGKVVALRNERPILRESFDNPAHLTLGRAALMIEGVAFDLALRQPPAVVSRLIEIAAELDRIAARTVEECCEPLPVRACAAE